MSLGLTQDFSAAVIYFAIYSFYGWVCETIYCSAIEKRYVQRGFLRGPYCPIYGFGASVVLWASFPLSSNPILVFIVTVIVASVLEYITGAFFERFFQLRLWDYSDYRFNIKGRVCLLNAILFGVLGLLAVYFVHPFTMGFVDTITRGPRDILASLLIVVFLVDFLQSVATVSDLNERLREVRSCMMELKRYQEEYSWFDRGDLSSSIDRLRTVCERDSGAASLSLLERLQALCLLKSRSDRFIRNYPTLKPVLFAEELETLCDNLDKKSSVLTSRMRRNIGKIKTSSRAMFRHIRQNAKTTALGFFAWTFVAGGIVGYFIRALLNSLAAGKVAGGQSVLYGPFAPLAALGAVLILLCVEPLTRENDRRLFLGGAILGGVLESIASWLDWKMLGMAFWGYRSSPYALIGTLGPLSILAWGIFGVILVRYVVPLLSGLLRGISAKQNKIFACLLVFLCIVDMHLSAAAFLRWSERHSGVAPRGIFQEHIDMRYPDETMRAVFPTVRFIGEE